MQKALVWIIVLILSSIVVMPIGFYAHTFGFGIWEKHNDWGVMGSALGGIYTSIFALLTLLILIGQTIFQLQAHRYSSDMIYISDNKDEYNELFDKLSQLLSDNSFNAQTALLNIVENTKNEELLAEKTINDVIIYSHINPQIIPLWIALQPILIGLSHLKRFPYEHSFLSIKLKTTSILTLRVCIALDKAYYIYSKGNTMKLQFWEI
ncbi:hypothetical protein [Plesiomonas shigelloides]|uniref:hypothetical protein n=1 Tax=Plesiomonas shigelloides TaxID=703 RepID=UPI0031B75AB5